MMSQVDFTLVITNYNKARFIDRAIRSCLMQLIFRRNIEIIVVDDASTDNSLHIVNEFKNDVRLLVNETNKGVATRPIWRWRIPAAGTGCASMQTTF